MKTEKLCRKHNQGAGEILPASAFYIVKNHQGKPSLSGYCKECMKQTAKDWLKAHPERARAAIKKVFVDHPEKKEEYKIRYRPKRAALAKAYRRRTPLKTWFRHLRRRYNLTPEWYTAKLAEQGGHCALCPNTDASGRKLNVDLNHATGEIRGILCGRCNNCLERMEIPGWHEKALAYLASYANPSIS